MFYLGAWIATGLSAFLARRKIKIRNGKLIISSLLQLNSRKDIFLNALICSTPMLLYSALRYGVGVDYMYYMGLFESPWRADAQRMPYLFKLLCNGMRSADLSFFWVIIITSCITIWLVFTAIEEDSPSCAASVFLYMAINFYFESMNVFRQGVAVAICVYSIRYIRQKRIIPFGICILLAAGFHKTAVVFSVAYLANFIHLPLSIQIMSILLLEPAKLMMNGLIMWVSRELGYEHYFFSKYYNTENVYLGLIICNVFVFFLFAIIYHLESKKEKMNIENNSMNVYLFLQYIATIVIIIGGLIPECHRIMYYFQWPSIVSIPYFLNKINRKTNRYALYTVVFLLFFFYSLRANYASGYTLFEYQTIFR